VNRRRTARTRGRIDRLIRRRLSPTGGEREARVSRRKQTVMFCRRRKRHQTGANVNRRDVNVRWSDVTLIYGHSTNSMLRGNASHSVKSSGEDLSRRAK